MLADSIDAQNVERIDDHAYTSLENRGSQEPIPSDLAYYLNEDQFKSLHSQKDFGWHLAFVRRPLFEPSTLVLINVDSKQYAVLEEDGSLNLNPPIKIRFTEALEAAAKTRQ